MVTENKGVAQNDVWTDIPFLPPSSKERKSVGYPTQKPKELIKRLRRHLDQYTNEKISFYAVGEYGPVHFRPHFHILLFFNSQEIVDVLRECHNKSWKFGRSDIQCSNGGCASYVASYVNSLASAPPLYRDWETDRKSTRLNSSHRSLSRMPSSA